MTELSPDAESLIAKASGGDEPSLLDAERVRTKIATRLALAAAAATTAATAPAQAISASTATISTATLPTAACSSSPIAVGAAGAAGSAKAGLFLSSKLLLALALGGGTAVLGAHQLLSAPSSSSLSQPATTPGVDQAAAAKNQTATHPQATARLPGKFDEAPSTHNSAPPKATQRTTAAVPQAAPTSSAPPTARSQLKSASFATADTVVEEAALLRQARTALANGATADATELLEQHRIRFPQGALIEERTATQVMAQCANGRNATTDRRAAEFLSAYPLSPLANPVRRACARSKL